MRRTRCWHRSAHSFLAIVAGNPELPTERGDRLREAALDLGKVNGFSRVKLLSAVMAYYGLKSGGNLHVQSIRIPRPMSGAGSPQQARQGYHHPTRLLSDVGKLRHLNQLRLLLGRSGCHTD